MTEKFESLVEDICRDHVIDISDGYSAAHDILGWLDENPDLVPARELGLSERDQIDAWQQVAEHPALEVCYRRVEDGTSFLDAVLDRLTELEEAAPRTITESELSEAVENSSTWTDEGFGRDVLSHFGIEVIPDPEPTNTDRLYRVILDDGVSTQGQAWSLAVYMDKHGVIAPNVKGN